MVSNVYFIVLIGVLCILSYYGIVLSRKLKSTRSRLENAEKQIADSQGSLDFHLSGLRHFAQKSDSVVFRASTNGEVVFLKGNPALSKLNSSGKTVEEVFSEYPEIIENLNECFEGGYVSSTLEVSDGTILLVAFPEYQAGILQGFEAIVLSCSGHDDVQAKLAESESGFRAIFDNAPFSIVIQRVDDGLFVDANKAFLRALNITLEDLPTMSVLDIVDLTAQEAEAIRHHIQKSGGVFNQETSIVRPNGEVRYTLYSSVPFTYRHEPCLISMTVDVTDQKRAPSAQQKSEEKFRAIFNNAPIGIFRTSYDGHFLEANATLARMLGYMNAQEMIAEVSDLSHDIYPDPSTRKWLLDHLLDTPEGVRLEIEFKRRDGEPFFAMINASLQFDDEGNPVFLDGSIEDISERKTAELALKTSEARYRTLFESLQDPILVIKEDGIIVDCNPRTEKVFGRSREEIIGRRPSELSPNTQPDGQFSGIKAENIIREAEEGRLMIFDWVHERPDGSSILVEISLASVAMGDSHYVLALMRDMTKRKEAERMLKLSEEKFSKVYEMAPYCIVILRIKDRVIMDVNDAFSILTGYDRNQTIGRTSIDMGLWAEPEMHARIWTEFLQNGLVSDLETIAIRKDGTRFNIALTGQVVEIAGESCAVFVMRDVTEAKMVQKMMVQTEKMMSLGGLAAGMAHEINNPLGIILQSARGMQRRLGAELNANIEEADALGLDLEVLNVYLERRNINRYIDGMIEAGQRAAGIVRNMLNFSRNTESTKVPFDLGLLARQAVSLAEKDYDLKKKYDFKLINVVLDVAPGLRPVRCLPTEMEQVLLNLLRNAAQAMAEAGTQNPSIRIGIRSEEEIAVIEIKDNGPGISSEAQSKVFEPFYTTKKVGEGTGLGLSVSYFIVVNTHGGTMTVESEPGQGTEFVITLPLVPPSE